MPRINRANDTLTQHHKFTVAALLLLTTALISSCSKKNYIQRDNYSFKAADGKPDYSDLNYWAAHPWKWNPSDSTPAGLEKDLYKDSTVDVFFVHPSTFTDRENNNWNAAIDDSLLNIKTDYSTILYQASVFNHCRVFAPRYRQAHIKAFFTTNKLQAAIAFDKAYADVKSSFQYYLDHFNNGRPIIIASHSQGTLHAARLLKDFFQRKNLQNRLVCAYLIGMPIADSYFTAITPCKDSLATGCIVSWRTFKKGYIDTGYISREKFNSIVVNPLTWSIDTLYAPAELNTGAVLRKFNKVSPHAVDAQVHENILWASKPKFFGSMFLTSSNFHIGDINLFYNNIRQNVLTRIKLFWKH